MRWIDADAAARYLVKRQQDLYAPIALEDVLNRLADYVDDCGKDADAIAPVVYCYECKHARDPEACPAAGWRFEMEPCDFCSYGERRKWRRDRAGREEKPNGNKV